jgi:tRNA pseudouridine38-40 synthase
MKRRYVTTLQYDGTDFRGWQIQPNARTVQGATTEALRVLLRADPELVGSGRTDAGVHALRQPASFVSPRALDVGETLHSLNGLLPRDVSAISLEETDAEFSARFSATRRTYLYVVSRAPSPFYRRYSWRLRDPLDVDYLNRASERLLGVHDFTSFAKGASELENPMCALDQARWTRRGDLTLFFVSANRFLHGMVRALVGSLVAAAREGAPIDRIDEIVGERDRKVAGSAAPARGLFLYRVEYGDRRF